MQTIINESQNAQVMVPTIASTKSVEQSTLNNTPLSHSESELTRAAVEELGSRVRLSDRDESTDLDLFCYVHCEPSDSRLLHECRGVVFHGEDIVMRAFPYTVEFDHMDEKSLKQHIQPVFKNCAVYDAYEGMLIRMFHFDGKWYTSTHRKLDAFRTKWASKESFGALFVKALEAEVSANEELCNAVPQGDEPLLERFQTTLDATKQYMFLVSHCEENRIVCATPSRPIIYHVGTFVDGELVMDEDIHIPHPQNHKFLNINELVNYVDNVDINRQQGVIVFAPGNQQFKILHSDYKELFDARGNEPSVKYRYLQVRMDNHIVKMLYHLYPEMIKTFEEYENILYAIAKLIYQSYVTRHIKNQWSILPAEEYKVDCACHVWHDEDRKNNRVNLNKVIEVLNEQRPTDLNRMIRRFRDEQTNQKDQVPTSRNIPAKSLLLSTKKQSRS